MVNRVIENLMYKSGLTAQGSFDTMDEYDQKAILLFGELIVMECAKLTTKAAEESKRTFYTVSETQEFGPALVARGAQIQAEKLTKNIKDHFEVK